eukprot:TRINITY_DN11745_c0_g1_i2.p1 TRINITY_DN11745_c0_g1~~TRINITY_DN11745_c0_g1_i2.p1  ORF type:complete len:636 (+),score=161.43 TRINITY_DN11745_c0_g1_i2:48-1955(+)
MAGYGGEKGAQVPAAYWAARGRHCVQVEGIHTGLLTHSGGEKSYVVDEMLLGDFFYEHGCKVKEVRLLIDAKADLSRGFAYVDFEDEASVQKALSLDGTKEVKGADDVLLRLDEKTAALSVSKPKAKSAEAQESARLLAKEKDSTDGLMRELRVREARLHQMVEELEREYKRQAETVDEDLDAQIDRQHQLQAEIRTQIQTAAEMEEVLESQLRKERQRRRGLERITASHDPPELPLNADAPPQLKRESSLPAASAELIRTISARSSRDILQDKMQELGEASPQVRSGLTRGTSAEQAPAVEKPVRRRWAEIDDEEEEEEAQHAEEEKAPVMNAVVAAAAQASTSVPTSREDEEEEEPVPADVKIPNLPQMPASELQEALREALERLWKAKGRPAPRITSIRIDAPNGSAPSKKSWADIARKGTVQKSPEAIVTFAQASDAKWLVDRQQADLSRSNLTLHGRLLQAVWTSAPVQDYRKFRPKITKELEPDAASNISYSTAAGTLCSHGSRIRKQSGSATTGGWDDQAYSLANRTVVLEGLPKELPVTFLRDEVKKAVLQAYRKDGFTFDPEVHFHYGIQGGVQVTDPRSDKDQNGGTCFLKFRFYSDAKWLVDQARSLRVAGKATRALWRRVRGQ